ncbi:MULTISPECIES: uroporphyrinogen-III synthase [Rhodomicrobium]|uniref:uroporphyrinogen-III synthase n=1 Tax=Rhodomicrobium TaxID=1068 RepID=UPI000B4B4CFF|nr:MULTISPECIES: uroporphyrinogen-III synthase [Rhodomicrobium]
MRIIVTRSGEDAELQAARLAALGHQPVIHPLLQIDYPALPPIALDGVQALILTSRNALRGLSRNAAFEAAKSLPAYCVGEGTADGAREHGFAHTVTGEGTAKDLVPLIAQSLRPQAGPLLYLTGAHLAFDLEAPLAQLGFAVTRLIVYESREPGEAAAARFAGDLRSGVDGVILMSPRGAANFIRIVKGFDLEREVRAIRCYCYSDAIAGALSKINGLTVAVSRRPTEAELMQLIGPVAA